MKDWEVSSEMEVEIPAALQITTDKMKITKDKMKKVNDKVKITKGKKKILKALRKKGMMRRTLRVVRMGLSSKTILWLEDMHCMEDMPMEEMMMETTTTQIQRQMIMKRAGR